MLLKTCIFFVLCAQHLPFCSTSAEERWDLDAYFAELDKATTTQERVVGGDNIDKGEYVKYQVSIQYLTKGRYRHFCGGSIISPNHVLTAAHCVVGQDPKKFSTKAGINNLEASDGANSQVEQIEVHEKYRRLEGNDIAILTINPPLVLDGIRMDKINVQCSDEIGSDEQAILSGWGSTRHSRSNPSFPSTLQLLKYTTLSNEECMKKMKMLTETEICAKAPRGKGACAGDSGGPLAMQNEQTGEMIQVGIVSYGRYRCGSDGLDVYTRVSKFDKWIKSRID